jgi:hypothetical protein
MKRREIKKMTLFISTTLLFPHFFLLAGGTFVLSGSDRLPTKNTVVRNHFLTTTTSVAFRTHRLTLLVPSNHATTLREIDASVLPVPRGRNTSTSRSTSRSRSRREYHGGDERSQGYMSRCSRAAKRREAIVSLLHWIIPFAAIIAIVAIIIIVVPHAMIIIILGWRLRWRNWERHWLRARWKLWGLQEVFFF